MPIPKPRKNERKDKFISRCISFQMNEESDPKKRSKKRKQFAAICYTQWNAKKSTEELNWAQLHNVMNEEDFSGKTLDKII